MSSQRILMFGWEYAPFYSGGLGIVTRSIIQNLKKQGLDIIFVLPKIPTKIEEEKVKFINASEVKLRKQDKQFLTEIEIEAILSPYMTKHTFKTELLTTMLENDLDSLKIDKSEQIYGNNLINEVENYAQKAGNIARSYEHDLIHTHDWMTARAGVVAKNISHKPLIAHVHATEIERSGYNPNQQVFEIEKEGFNQADKIIAVSELTKDRIVKYYGIDPDKISVVHNAIDKIPNANRLARSLNKTDKIVLFLGRLTVQKGADYLLEAAEKVIRNKKRIKFIFIGQGDMLEHLIHKTIDLGIEQKVMFAGFMSHDEVDQAYKLADVFVMPSVSEPFGITALEAIQNGTPVIVSKQSGVGEVIKNSLKVDFWDTDELANQILAIVRYSPLSMLIAKNAEDELRKINWTNQSKKIVEIYNQVQRHETYNTEHRA